MSARQVRSESSVRNTWAFASIVSCSSRRMSETASPLGRPRILVEGRDHESAASSGRSRKVAVLA